MAEPRSAAQEAEDPSTSPDRLLELTEKHPQLQKLIVLNPSCPEVARQWILATNPWAKQAYEQSLEQATADDAASDAHDATPENTAPPAAADDAPTALHPAVGDDDTQVPGIAPMPVLASSDQRPGPLSESAPEDPDAVSAWGDFEDDALWGGEGSAAEPAPGPPTPSVRIAQDAGVVPLGPAPSPAPSPASAESPAAPAPSPAPAPAPHPHPHPHPLSIRTTPPRPSPAHMTPQRCTARSHPPHRSPRRGRVR